VDQSSHQFTRISPESKPSFLSARESRAMGPLHAYRFTSESTVYGAVDQLMREDVNWQEGASERTFNLLLADRWNVPYARLGLDAGYG